MEHAPRSGRVELPRKLWKQLPGWQRRWRALVVTPLSILGLLLLILGDTVRGSVVVAAAVGVDLLRFWLARAYLVRHGAWERGTWYAEVLPAIYRWRAAFFATLTIAAAGSTAILGWGVRSALVTLATSAALVLVPAVYAKGCLVQGRVGTWPIHHDRQQDPGRFWGGLVTYTCVLASLCLFVLLLVRHATRSGP